ncbi:MAG TPA: nucleotidyltransferase family protein [Gaiellaceae bacterium]|jgi:NDP-sugar pyrophosphorylase family protein|nr:nucleotidyltransferase family protein [Gaiellaceae bacterium]
MEAIILAGGTATRLGDAARGLPKALVPICGHPLAEYQVSQLVRAGVERVIVSCAHGQADIFEAKLSGLGAEIVAIAEPAPLGRGGGLRYASAHREESGPIYAFNGDELHDVDLGALLDAHRDRGAAATIVVAPLTSQFGVVDLADDDRIAGFREAPRLPHWVNAGIYVLDDEAIRRLPEQGDHEQSTFPELAGEGRLFAFRHEGLWITVNTPKDLDRAEAYYTGHPELRPSLARGGS